MTTRYPEGPAASPGFLLWHLTLAWQRAVTAVLEPLGLTQVQFVLLASAWWLDSHGQVPNQLGLARHAGTDVKMTSQVVRRLEAKGLLEREVDPRFFGQAAGAVTSLLQRLTGRELPRPSG